MIRRAVIIGTGKMAGDIGACLLNRGWSLHWVSASEERLGAIERTVHRMMRRLALGSPELIPTLSNRFVLPEALDPDAASVVIESTREDTGVKREMVHRVLDRLKTDPLVLSNSSSILPAEIWAGALGLHFFFPIQLTELAELIIPPSIDEPRTTAATAFAQSLGLQLVIQDENHAFATNRLLLPLQAEAFRALQDGWSPEVVDTCSTSILLPIGQLTLIDSIGRPVFAAAVQRYVSCMPPSFRADYRPLIDGVCSPVNTPQAVGAPFPHNTPDAAATEALKARLQAIFINTCLRFVDDGLFTRDGLDLVLSRVFGAERPFAQVLDRLDRPRVIAELNRVYRETSADYSRPSPSLRSGGS